MNGYMRFSIVNLTLLCIGLIGGLMLVMTGIAVNKSLTQLIPRPQALEKEGLY